MTRVTPGFRVFAVAGLLISPLLATAQRPVISSCTASPSMLGPGGTAKLHVQATSPSGLPLHYIFTSTAGTVQGDGASAVFTAGATGFVTVLCEARDSHDSWVRSRTWVKVVGTATAVPATPKPTPVEPASAAGGVSSSAAKVAPATHSTPPAVTHSPPPPMVTRSMPQPSVAAPVAAPSMPVPSSAAARAATAPAGSAHPTTQAPQVAAGTQAHLPTTPSVATPAPVPAQAAPLPTAPPIVSVPPSAAATNSAETAQPSPDRSAVNEGVKQSNDGLIEYTVPQKMVVGTASKVTVKIHGYSVAANTTRSESLTAQYMKVLLIAEDPSGLKIVAQGRADIQYVPKNKTATWVWSVTPMGTVANQKLQVRVFEEYKTDAEQDVDEESYAVNVTTPSRLMLAKEAYFNDPDAWWKYWLPSGAGCLVLIGIFLRLINPRKRTPEGMAQNFEASDWL